MPNRGSLGRSRQPPRQRVFLSHRPLRPQTLRAKSLRHAGRPCVSAAPSSPQTWKLWRSGSPPTGYKLNYHVPVLGHGRERDTNHNTRPEDCLLSIDDPSRTHEPPRVLGDKRVHPAWQHAFSLDIDCDLVPTKGCFH